MVCDTHTADALYSFKACQGTAPNSDDICKAMGHTESVYDIDDTPCSIIDGDICSKIQDCNVDGGCTVSCFTDDYVFYGGTIPGVHHTLCTGCRSGKVKMETENHKYNFNITCIQNGEEMPGDFVCAEKCGCVKV